MLPVITANCTGYILSPKAHVQLVWYNANYLTLILSYLGTNIPERLTQIASGAILSKQGGLKGDSDITKTSEETPEDPGLTISADLPNSQSNGHVESDQHSVVSNESKCSLVTANEDSGDKPETNEKPCSNGLSHGEVITQVNDVE